MKKQLFLFFLSLLVTLLVSCTGSQYSKRRTPPVSWPTINKTESEFKKELDINLLSLDFIEGIWTLQVEGIARHIPSEKIITLPTKHPYRLAIFRDTTYPNYDFVAVVLESKHINWLPGRIKAHFRKTAYEKVYETLWYMGDYHEEKIMFLIDESGLVKSSITEFLSKVRSEVNKTLTLIKAYPPLTDKVAAPSQEKLKASGSGFIISKNGLVITNFHVVEDASKIVVVFPEKKLTKTAIIKIKDSQNDIVILELDDFSYSDIAVQDIPFPFADISSIRV